MVRCSVGHDMFLENMLMWDFIGYMRCGDDDDDDDEDEEEEERVPTLMTSTVETYE